MLCTFHDIHREFGEKQQPLRDSSGSFRSFCDNFGYADSTVAALRVTNATNTDDQKLKNILMTSTRPMTQQPEAGHCARIMPFTKVDMTPKLKSRTTLLPNAVVLAQIRIAPSALFFRPALLRGPYCARRQVFHFQTSPLCGSRPVKSLVYHTGIAIRYLALCSLCEQFL